MQIPYTCVEVGPLFKEELKWSKYKKVGMQISRKTGLGVTQGWRISVFDALASHGL